MTSTDLIDRNCPLCKSNAFDELGIVPNESFISINEGLNKELVKETKIDQLPDISIVKCKQCGFTFTNKHLNDNWLGKLYGEIIDVKHSQKKIFRNIKRLNYINLWHKIANYFLSFDLNKSTEVEILELGAGWGDFLEIAKGPGIKVTGIEYDERKRERLSKENIINYKTIDAVPKKKKYNIFFSNAVFEHITDPLETMEKIDELLTDDFIGYLAVPNYALDRLVENLNMAVEGHPIDKSISTWEHVNYFSPIKLWDLLDGFRYEVIDINSKTQISRDDILTTEVFFRRKT